MKILQSPARSGSRVVLVKGTDGLGNRILALLSAILYAKLAGRAVIVDWCDGSYAAPGTNAFPLLFRSDFATALDQDLPAESVMPWMWERRLHVSAEEMHGVLGPRGARGCPFVGRLYSFDPATLHHRADVIVMWSLVHLVGELRRHFTGSWSEWRALSDEAILARLLRENLDVQPEIAARTEAIRRTWPDRPRIGVHVRNTDRTTNLHRLRRRLDGLIANEPDAAIFLATDAAGVEDDFRRRYPDVLTVPKWFPPSGPLHALDAPCPDRAAMARDSLVDMRLLATCEHLVINGNSSFSQITKLWWQGDPRRVIDVGSWARIPASIRERAWRTRDAVKWTAWLRMAHRHIRMQRSRELNRDRNPGSW